MVDPELNLACGERLATSPEQLDSILLVQWSRSKIGEYQHGEASFIVKDQDGREERLPATSQAKPLHHANLNVYRYLCEAARVDVATGRITGCVRIKADDPENVELRSSMYAPSLTTRSAPDGHGLARQRLLEWIGRVCNEESAASVEADP
jgi:hypothetical protein